MNVIERVFGTGVSFYCLPGYPLCAKPINYYLFESYSNMLSSFTAVPFSVVGIAITQALITKGNNTNISKCKSTANFKLTLQFLSGTLSASPRFGSLPKVACKYKVIKLWIFYHNFNVYTFIQCIIFIHYINRVLCLIEMFVFSVTYSYSCIKSFCLFL